MHPEFSQMTMHHQQSDLDRRTRAAFARQPLPEPAADLQEAVVLRLCTVADDAALERLAILETRPAPAGRYVVAEVDGAVVAAISLVSGTVLADPFRPTAEAAPAARAARRAAGTRGSPPAWPSALELASRLGTRIGLSTRE